MHDTNSDETNPKDAQKIDDVLKEVLDDGGDILPPETETETEAETGAEAEAAPESAPEPTSEPSPEPSPEPTPEEQIAALNDQLLRSLAEIENTRRRSERERSEALKYGAASLAKDILSVADNLNRALLSISDSTDETQTAFIEGVTATERELQAILQRHRITPINPVGEKFNPNQHEALFEVPLSQSTAEQAGMVVEVVEVGYMLEDRLLRPAKVGISKAE